MAETAAQRRWRLANPEHEKERHRIYREANRELLREKGREYVRANKEKRAAYGREYAQRSEVKARKQTEAYKQYMREYREANKEKLAEQWQEWYEKNHDYAIERGKTAWQVRRARKMAAERVESINRKTVYDRDGGRCHICRKKVARRAFHVDHLVPLGKGGNHTYDNVAIAHPKCNLRRNDGKLPAQLRLLA